MISVALYLPTLSVYAPLARIAYPHTLDLHIHKSQYLNISISSYLLDSSNLWNPINPIIQDSPLSLSQDPWLHECDIRSSVSPYALCLCPFSKDSISLMLHISRSLYLRSLISWYLQYLSTPELTYSWILISRNLGCHVLLGLYHTELAVVVWLQWYPFTPQRSTVFSITSISSLLQSPDSLDPQILRFPRSSESQTQDYTILDPRSLWLPGCDIRSSVSPYALCLCPFSKDSISLHASDSYELQSDRSEMEYFGVLDLMVSRIRPPKMVRFETSQIPDIQYWDDMRSP